MDKIIIKKITNTNELKPGMIILNANKALEKQNNSSIIQKMKVLENKDGVVRCIIDDENGFMKVVITNFIISNLELNLYYLVDNDLQEDIKSDTSYFNKDIINLKRENRELKKKVRKYKTILKNNFALTENNTQDKQEHVTIIMENTCTILGSIYDVVAFRKNSNTIFVNIFNHSNSAKGQAICHDEDEFNVEIGIELAFARAKAKLIENILK